MSSPSDSRPGATRGVPTGPAFPALLRRPLHAWRSSVSLRVVVTTLALSLVVAGLVGWLLLGRITSGLLDAKERASVAEAASGAADAQRQLDAAYTGPQTRSASVIVDNLMSGLALRADASRTTS